MYALDIHSNSFFPLFVWLYVVQVRQTTLLVFFVGVVACRDFCEFSMHAAVSFPSSLSVFDPGPTRSPYTQRAAATNLLKEEHHTNRESCFLAVRKFVLSS